MYTTNNGVVTNFTDTAADYLMTDNKNLTVPVLYDPNNPQNAISAGWEDYWLSYWGPTVTLFAISVFLLIDSLRKIIKRR